MNVYVCYKLLDFIPEYKMFMGIEKISGKKRVGIKFSWRWE